MYVIRISSQINHLSIKHSIAVVKQKNESSCLSTCDVNDPPKYTRQRQTTTMHLIWSKQKKPKQLCLFPICCLNALRLHFNISWLSYGINNKPQPIWERESKNKIKNNNNKIALAFSRKETNQFQLHNYIEENRQPNKRLVKTNNNKKTTSKWLSEYLRRFCFFCL